MDEITELYRKFRPKQFKDVWGQENAIKVLGDLLAKKRVPRAILFCGPSGTGKTTLARILAEKLGCSGTDFQELNCAEARGIDMVRDIKGAMGYAPMSGKCRVWLLDECHRMTGDAGSALLKLLEDTPSHVYFFLATTDPQKLLKTIVTRCTEVKTQNLTPKTMCYLLEQVQAKSKTKITEEVRDRIVEFAEGSARKALVILNQVIGLETEDEQLEAVQKSDSRQETFALCKALVNPRVQWKEVAAILKKIEEDPEGIRRMVLGYFNTILLNRGDKRSAFVIDRFQANFFDSGKAGLTLACYEVVTASR